MNKKGFTLVELLAVIAILAILVIIALPNVLSMYRQARMNSFTNEVNNILKVTRQQYFLDGATGQTYTNVGDDTNELDLSGGANIQYYVETNAQGDITKIQVTNGTYQYDKSGTIEFASSNDVQDTSELDPSERLVIGESASGSGSGMPSLPGHGN